MHLTCSQNKKKKRKNQNKTLRAQREERHINYYYHYWQVCQSSAYKALSPVDRRLSQTGSGIQSHVLKEEGQASLANRDSYRSSTSAKFIFVTARPPSHIYCLPQSPCPGISTPCGLCCSAASVSSDTTLSDTTELPSWAGQSSARRMGLLSPTSAKLSRQLHDYYYYYYYLLLFQPSPTK